MASIEFKVTLTDGSTMVRTAVVSDGDVVRLLATFADKYQAPMVTQTVTNPETQEVTTIQVPGEKTGDYLVGKWIEETVVTAMNYALGVEQSKAAQQAAANVQMIPFTLS